MVENRFEVIDSIMWLMLGKTEDRRKSKIRLPHDCRFDSCCHLFKAVLRLKRNNHPTRFCCPSSAPFNPVRINAYLSHL